MTVNWYWAFPASFTWYSVLSAAAYSTSKGIGGVKQQAAPR